MDIFFKFLLLFGIPSVLYFSYVYWRQFSAANRLKNFENSPFPQHFEMMLGKFLPYQALTSEEKKRFQSKFLYFLEDKNFNGVGELIVTEEMKVLIAAEACLMITNISGGVYPGLKNIYIAEDVFIPKDNPVNFHTGQLTHVARLGEAWKSGPVVLSWKSIVHGSSVIFHEFSHQLDQQDGSFDGTPNLGSNGNYDKWALIMGQEFIQLRKRIEAHRSSDIDNYGATNEAEFFAVVTEYYFTRPNLLKEKHPQIYEIYQDYFGLNPIRWLKNP
jgi:Mlc titration factor MtfA (ptsG expression regulator)